jgi:hypothetical protein
LSIYKKEKNVETVKLQVRTSTFLKAQVSSFRQMQTGESGADDSMQLEVGHQGAVVTLGLPLVLCAPPFRALDKMPHTGLGGALWQGAGQPVSSR